ncbi:MAG: response regulator transcription factor [Geminicoccaceae bacterium]|nr:response regulator transcription factor [Geminicoccaceae bacterium]
MRVLVVEDNQRIGQLTAHGLRQRGFACDRVEDLAATELALACSEFDAMVLDLGLPDGDGLEWLRHHRTGNLPPTIILTARATIEERVLGLDAGADDYLSKPFELAELAARLRAMLRRPGRRDNVVIEIGPLCFDPARQVATAAGRGLVLSRRELGLLELLMRRAGEVVRRAQIESALYRFDEAVTPNAVEAVVSRLRRKLDEAGVGHRLHTVRGLGYILADERT